MNTFRNLSSIILSSVNDNRSILPRIIVGLIFLSEGIQKYLFPELVGAARFEKIGFSNPEFLAAFVATFEMICGVLVLIGLLTRLASIPLLIIMATALVTTKIPILLNKGIWAMAHESRTDFAMTLLLVYLLIYGTGKWSVDSKIYKPSKT
ncbi:MAG: DoxX family protein [Bacteroidetes bacterium GWA2_31_9b]|nr:MAG: DoxX family protein [Bacteroidetes bacterium GWA2_31_9b]